MAPQKQTQFKPNTNSQIPTGKLLGILKPGTNCGPQDCGLWITGSTSHAYTTREKPGLYN